MLTKYKLFPKKGKIGKGIKRPSLPMPKKGKAGKKMSFGSLLSSMAGG